MDSKCVYYHAPSFFTVFRPLFIDFSTIIFRFFLNSFVLIPRLVPLFHHFMILASDVTGDVDDVDLCSRQHFFEKDHQIWSPWTLWPRFWDFIFSSIFFSNASDSRFHLVKLSWQILARRFQNSVQTQHKRNARFSVFHASSLISRLRLNNFHFYVM